MSALLGHEDVPWEATQIFQVDERIAPDGDPDRNLTHLEECLPAAALQRLRPMPVTAEPPEDGAASYAALLPEVFDLIHLGLGPDGHTASLVPGDPVLEVTEVPVAITGTEYQGRRRMTLTYPAINAGRQLLWLVTGAEKREALTGLLAGDHAIPAGRVESGNAVVLADAAATG
jgi:6-phosphogluconolactonase/glucosamine-6-phosphate isomerase/deaminase